MSLQIHLIGLIYYNYDLMGSDFIILVLFVYFWFFYDNIPTSQDMKPSSSIRWAYDWCCLHLQVLQERGESTSRHGRATFSVLLFQVILWTWERHWLQDAFCYEMNVSVGDNSSSCSYYPNDYLDNSCMYLCFF